MRLNTNETTATETLPSEVASAHVVLMGLMTTVNIPDPRPHFMLCDEEEEEFSMVDDNPFWADEPSELVF